METSIHIVTFGRDNTWLSIPHPSGLGIDWLAPSHFNPFASLSSHSVSAASWLTFHNSVVLLDTTYEESLIKSRGPGLEAARTLFRNSSHISSAWATMISSSNERTRNGIYHDQRDKRRSGGRRMDFRYSANQTVSGFISAFDKRIAAAYSSPVKYFIPFGRRIFATWPPEGNANSLRRL